MKVLRKYVGKLNWLATNTRPDIAIHALELAKKQKKATLKDLKEVNNILKKVHEKESRVMFKRLGDKKELCVTGVSEASYKNDDRSVAGEIIMLANERNMDISPIYWKSGVIKRVCMSPKAAETRALMKMVDDSTNLARQVSQLLGLRIRTRLFTDSRPLLESIGSSSQIEEKNLRQSIMYFKQALESGDVMGYSWIQGEEIVADVLTKRGSRREALNEIVLENRFSHAQTRDNWVSYENGEFKIRNKVTKKQKQETQ